MTVEIAQYDAEDGWCWRRRTVIQLFRTLALAVRKTPDVCAVDRPPERQLTGLQSRG